MATATIRERHPDVFDDMMKRLKRIEGQARGVQRMLETGAPCEDILVQVSAIRAALNRVGLKVLGCHLGSRVVDEIAAGGSGQAAVEESLETFLRLG